MARAAVAARSVAIRIGPHRARARAQREAS